MKNSKIILLLVFISAFYACSNTPSCNQEDVKELVSNIVKKKVKKELKNKYFWEHYYELNDAREFAKDKGLNVDKIVNEKKEELKLKSESFVEGMSFKIKNIRLLKLQEKLKKCSCVANFIINDELIDEQVKNMNIIYTAQYTEDGNIYVEVTYN